MKKSVCTTCGYTYDPEYGDLDGGIDPDTPFEDIPEDWICPLCSTEKKDFELEDIEG
jgi:rubredoxin